MVYCTTTPGEPQILFHTEIHQSASQKARAAYLDEYGIDYHDDPEWKIGNERHAFWLSAFEARQKLLILDPNQD